MCHYHLVKWSFCISYSNLGISLVSLFLHPLLLVVVFYFMLLFLILLSFLHLYWLYQCYKCFCIVLPSSRYLVPFWSLVQVCLTLGVQKLLYSLSCFVFLFLQYLCPSVTFGLLPLLLCLCQLYLTMVCLLCPHPAAF